MSGQIVPQNTWYSMLLQGTTAVPKSIAKLFDTVSDQIGLFLEPVHIKRKAVAEADAAIVSAKATAEIREVEVTSKLRIDNIQDRAAERTRKKEQRRQQNIESINAKAANELPDDVSEKPVDPDWVAQFFESCQDVSNDDMQQLWARILAGEVTTPGSFSRRTMAFVKTIDHKTAGLFTKFCTCIWKIDNNITPIIFEQDIGGESSLFKFTELVLLDSLGLIRFEPLSGFRLTFSNPTVQSPFSYFDHKYLLSKTFSGSTTPEMEIGKCMISEIGVELSSIAGSTSNHVYRDRVIDLLRSKGWIILGN